MKRRILILALAVLLLAGCDTKPDASAAGSSPSGSVSIQTPADTGPKVWTDWSKLTPQPSPVVREEVYQRKWEKYTDHLIPQTDYGTLIPYAGSAVILSGLWGESGYLYGLMTLDGQVVVDPVYTNIIMPVTYDSGGKVAEQSDVLILQQTVGEGGSTWGGTLVGAAAVDGSWCTEIKYLAYLYRGEELFFYAADCVEHWSTDGTLLNRWTWKELGLENEAEEITDGENFIFGGQEFWRGNYIWLMSLSAQDRMLNLDTGGVEYFSQETLIDPYPAPERADNEGWNITWDDGSARLTRGEEEHIIPYWDILIEVEGGLVFLRGSSGGIAVYTLDGKELISPESHNYSDLIYDKWHRTEPPVLLEVKQSDATELWDLEGNLVSPVEEYASVDLAEGVLETIYSDGWVTYYNLDTGECLMSRRVSMPEF